MSTDTTLKDYLRESRLIRQRVGAAMALSAILMLLLVARLIYLQVINHEHFTTLSRVTLSSTPSSDWLSPAFRRSSAVTGSGWLQRRQRWAFFCSRASA